ncbi:hypothetical protein ACIP79_24465 [Streptomyces sp. NPDC088747]|uniref:hypothetical protein n=1 Tax=Streptomyces sp. NPDC088747 TaxID=3365886 RepID=UPI00382803E4
MKIRTPAWPRYDARTGAVMSLSACDTAPSGNASPAACSKASTRFDEEHNLGFWKSL